MDRILGLTVRVTKAYSFDIPFYTSASALETLDVAKIKNAERRMWPVVKL